MSLPFCATGLKCCLQAPLYSAFHFQSIGRFLGLSFRGPHPFRWLSHPGDLLTCWGFRMFYMAHAFGVGVTLSSFPPQNLAIFLHFHVPDYITHQKCSGQLSVNVICHRPFLLPKLSLVRSVTLWAHNE